MIVKIAALYDIHGNAPALEALLTEVDAADPDAPSTWGTASGDPPLESVREALRWCAARLAPDDIAALRTWPALQSVDIGGIRRVLFCHATPPFDRTVGSLRVVNAGSVGMPFGAPGAHWLLLGPDIAPQRTDYDRESAARIRVGDYPYAKAFAVQSVLNPPPESAALDALTRAWFR